MLQFYLPWKNKTLVFSENGHQYVFTELIRSSILISCRMEFKISAKKTPLNNKFVCFRLAFRFLFPFFRALRENKSFPREESRTSESCKGSYHSKSDPKNQGDMLGQTFEPIHVMFKKRAGRSALSDLKPRGTAEWIQTR